MLIRRAETKDIPGLLALLQQVGAVHNRIRPDIFRVSCQKYDDAALKALLEDPLRPVFVATDGDFVAGYCFCVHKDVENSPVFEDRKELYIDDLCVDENRRGGGIATALFRHVQTYGTACGCTVITLNVWCGNDSAMTFYEKMGMKERNITMELPL